MLYRYIMLTISACNAKDDTCYISERLPSLLQEGKENKEEEQCVVGGSFPATKNIQYNPSTGDCEFLYVDLMDDNCNLYTCDTGTGSLGLKARIDVKNNPDVMFIQFTNNKGLTFYNNDDERVAKRSIDLVLSMMPHPFASGHRRLYYKASVKNDTPHEVNYIKIEYKCCNSDENFYIASGGTWTAGTYRGGCLVTWIHSNLILHDGNELMCKSYFSSGTSYDTFFIMLIDGICCLRSDHQSNTECTNQVNDDDDVPAGLGSF